MQVARLPLQNLFLGEGHDDFFETGVAAEWVPKRKQLQLTVRNGSRWLNSDRELFTGQIFVTSPRCNHCQITDHARAVDCIMFHRQERNCPATFAQSIVCTSKSSIN